jgi:hypothetical protein
MGCCVYIPSTFYEDLSAALPRRAAQFDLRPHLWSDNFRQQLVNCTATNRLVAAHSCSKLLSDVRKHAERTRMLRQSQIGMTNGTLTTSSSSHDCATLLLSMHNKSLQLRQDFP